MEEDEKLLRELEALGFSKASAARALSSGNSSIEAAVNWLVDHENDTAASETEMGLVNINIDASNPFHISEQVKLRAQELRNQARKKQAEQAKKLQREKKKERKRAGRELLEAKRMAEERERKRFLAQREAEKEEEKRARERIRQKLQQDKLERRGMHGLPREESLPTKPVTASPQVTKNLHPVGPAVLPGNPFAVREQMRECLRSLKCRNKDDSTKATRAFQTLLIYVKNIVHNPEEGKFKKIRMSNPAFQDRVGRYVEGIKFLELCGFQRVEGDDFLLLPEEKVDIGTLKLAWAELQNALTNPYFGLFSV